MDEGALIFIVVANVIFYIIIPLVMLYRRGYFFNFSERLEWLRNIRNRKSMYQPEDWTIIKVRPLSKFEKRQIQNIVIKLSDRISDLLRKDGAEYRAVITLNSGKEIKYIFVGENKGYWLHDTIHKDNILLRTWQKGENYYYDLVPIKEKSVVNG